MKGFVSSRLHPAANLLLLVGLMLLAFCVAGFFMAVFSNLFFGVGLREIGNVTQEPSGHPQGWGVSMLSQGMLLFIGFGGAALALPRLTGYSLADYFTPRRPVPLDWLLAAAGIILLSVPFMSGLIEWNASAHFPGFLKGWEAGAREMENRAQDLTRYLTQFSTPTRFVVGLLVIAVVPAISEELVFRGVVQRNLVQWTGSRHVGIWLAAATFSAIHFQFFGFVPRFVLGLVLGYLYEWSGNILVPMAAHFTQNAFQIILLYAQQRGALKGAGFDPESTDALPWWWQVLSLLLTGAVLWLLYKRTRELRPDPLPTQMHTLGSGGKAIARPTTPPPAARTLSHDGVDTTR
ncbi:CPBP family intramembrane glutamic endopeptidase [Hymenobacter canadensis]|uniref:CPBP family intramembrane metalloprotease n=1 Tax=Hymenobacter canadensis TaxID=2999067 RepID=A0ABY7LNU6_9BACT|nr:CPBP family intramembrane glutamic endopeptidase [Hymenobacter canadensis]WBA41274.1 CPBP family intramembrane metalloprotease [Hymenobacter canadensis]